MTPTILPLLARFRNVFSAPSFENFQFLMLAWLMNPQRGWISNCLRTLLHMPDLFPVKHGGPKHFSCMYRFFTRARWNLDDLGHAMARAFERWLPDSITIIIDDTLCKRSGPMILGGGVHHDPLRSRMSQGKQKAAFSFGLNFVVLAIWVPVTFIRSGGVAIPVLFRLHRSKKTCPPKDYRTRSEQAAIMLGVIRSWWPKRHFEITVDHEYACKTVLAKRDENMTLNGPMRSDAALYQPERPVYRGSGRPVIWGKGVHLLHK